MQKGGCVYILASKGKRLYTGVTSTLMTRIHQHKSRLHPSSFTARYNIDQLVFYQGYQTITEAITRESQIKNMHRIQKIQLIVSTNPDWQDLSSTWGTPTQPFQEENLLTPQAF